MEKLDEVINRILELEKDKKELADMIPWKAEFPKQKEALEKINQQLHELRGELEKLKNSPVAAQKTDEEGAFRGFFA